MSIRTEQEFPSGQWLQAGVQETQFTMVTGGPNTGKTRRVIERVAFLLQRGEFPPASPVSPCEMSQPSACAGAFDPIQGSGTTWSKCLSAP